MLSTTASNLANLIQTYNSTYNLMREDIKNGNEYIVVSAKFNSTELPSIQSHISNIGDCKTKLAEGKCISGKFEKNRPDDENNCIGYTSGTWSDGNDIIIVNSQAYYTQKLTEIYEKIILIIGDLDADNRQKTEAILGVDPPNNNMLDTIKIRKDQLNTIANQYDLTVANYTISYDKLKSSNIMFRSWVFFLLLVIFITFQLVKNPIANSLSFVSLFFMIVILFSIVYIFQPLLFMISLLLLFMVITLTFFYKQQYYLSVVVLIIEYIIFAVIYRI